MGYFNTRAAAVVALALVTLASAESARAGTVLLARESNIQASGVAGSANFNLVDGSQDFSSFADLVDTLDAGLDGPHVAANQHSRPSLDENDALTGAYAEGAASAALNADDPADAALAVSNFDLTFQVLGVPSVVTFGGSVGVTGNGSTSVCLSNESTGHVVLSQELLDGGGEGQTIQHSTILEPGVYELSVEAAVSGEPGENMAYYTVSLSIAALTGDYVGPTPIPLPPAAWSGLAVLVAGGATHGLRRLQRLRRFPLIRT